MNVYDPAALLFVVGPACLTPALEMWYNSDAYRGGTSLRGDVVEGPSASFCGWSLPMYIDDFVWLPDMIDKLAARHGVSQDEAEEVFFNRPRYRFVETGHRPGEDVYVAGGQTDAGRYVIVFFIHKAGNTALILSARDMDRRERRRYERK